MSPPTNVNVDPESPFEESTSLTLLARIRKNDEIAWERLSQLYGPLVYDWCRRMGLSSPDAADVGQEVFVRVWQCIGSFRKQRAGDTFRGWLRVITKRKAQDFWRKRSREQTAQEAMAAAELTVTDFSPNPDEMLPDESEQLHEKQVLYRRAIDLLRGEFSEKTVQAFWKTVVEARTAGDVADELSISVNSVYIAKSRVLARLRSELASE